MAVKRPLVRVSVKSFINLIAIFDASLATISKNTFSKINKSNIQKPQCSSPIRIAIPRVATYFRVAIRQALLYEPQLKLFFALNIFLDNPPADYEMDLADSTKFAGYESGTNSSSIPFRIHFS